MAIALDISPLNNAVRRLEEGLRRYQSETRDDQIRDGLIQRFEFTYEQSHKMLKRYLEKASPSPEMFDEMPFPDLIRTANEQGMLLGEWEQWRVYRKMRGKTSHTYDETIALEVARVIPDFLKEAVYLLEQLRKRTS